MMEFLRAGGWGSWLVLLLGAITLYTAARFAWKADARRLSIIRALTAATIFSTLTAMTSGLVKVMSVVSSKPELRASGDAPYVALEGLGEIATLPTLGFSLLTLAWLFVAVGTRRLQDRDL